MLVFHRPLAFHAPDKIVTGSFQGMLRIYHPKQAGHQVDDLMLEASLDAPVLQLSAGRFIAYETRTHIYL